MFVSLNRVDGERGFPMGVLRINLRHVVAFGPYEANKYATDDAEALDNQGNMLTEILFVTGHTVFVSETPSEVARQLNSGGN